MGLTIPVSNTSAGNLTAAYMRIGKVELSVFENEKVAVKLLGYKSQTFAEAKKAALEADRANDDDPKEDYEKQYNGAGCCVCPKVAVDLTAAERDQILSILYGAVKRSTAKGIGETLDFTKAKDILEEGQQVAAIK